MQQRQNSRPGQRRDNLKVFNKSQKSYLPKATALSNSDKKPVPGGTGQNYDESGNRLVTSSLGQNSDRKPVNYKNGGDGKSSLESNSKQVWRGSSGNGAKMSSDKGRFVKYLPQDDAVAAGLGVEDGGLNPEETQGVADLLNQELRALLGMKAREFWRTGEAMSFFPFCLKQLISYQEAVFVGCNWMCEDSSIDGFGFC